MNVNKLVNGISCRHFFAVAGLTAGSGLLARRSLFAMEEGIVPTMVNAAAKARISVQPIRRLIKCLIGSLLIDVKAVEIGVHQEFARRREADRCIRR